MGDINAGNREDANQWVVENSERKKSAGVHQVDTYTTLQAQIASIAKDVKQLTLAQAQMTQSIICDFCAEGHPTHECQQVPLAEEEVNVVGNYNRGNNFNAMGQKHPDSRGVHRMGQQGNQSNLEEMFKSFITKVDEKFENQSASIRNLEKQVGQIANQISERTPGTLPSDKVRNPKDLKAVTLRSGKMLSENCQSPKEKSRESQVEKKESHEIKKGAFFSFSFIHQDFKDTQPYGESTKEKKIGVVPSKRGSSSTQKGSNSSKEKEPPPLKSYDATKFVSWKAQQRFKVYQEIVRRKWEVLFEQPEEANMTVVMEFYANLPEHEYQVCMVRGKTVNFAQEAIENAYNFPKFGGTVEDEYRTTYMKEPYKWDMFIEVICTSG
ncbi:hypothetical protein H5410_062179 [Solanum commersonii]|uniref:Putative plant transposon protein domain-containing protein n=1 Tax=Solanum commersonii TaxID=4109 RepID=A0A9J5WA41_SOLCO|nr:hypothetical protein H5410_062179 [Solanum commersonii]